MPTDNLPALQAEWITPIARRKALADHYFQDILAGQQDWYSSRAIWQKRSHLGLAIAVIVGGALISCLQVSQAEWVPAATALLGAAVTVIRALDTLLRPGETWQAYRKAAENMKREYRLYLNNADVYGEAADEAAAYQLLVARVESAIAEEQQLFWRARDKNPPAKP